MPSFLKSEKDKEDEISSSGSSTVKTEDTGSGTLDSGGTSVSQSNVAPKSSSFVGIQQYLKQNQPQSAQLAEKIGGGVQTEVNRAQEQLGQIQPQFENKVKESEQIFNPEALNKISQSPTSLSDTEKQQIKTQQAAVYTGPKGLEETELYQPAQAQVFKAQQQAKYVSSDEGRKTLLKSIQDKRATQGVTNLNNLLLGSNPDINKKMEQYTAGSSDLDTRLKALSDAAVARSQQAAANTLEARNKTKQAVSGAVTGFQSDIDKRLADARTAAANKVSSAQQALKGEKEMTAQDLAELGITADQWKDIGNWKNWQSDYANRATFLSPENEIQRENIASQDDIAKQKVLAELSGQDLNYVGAPKETQDMIKFDYAATRQKQLDGYNREFDLLNSKYQGMDRAYLSNVPGLAAEGFGRLSFDTNSWAKGSDMIRNYLNKKYGFNNTSYGKVQ